MQLPNTIKIVEVGPRDGLQNESQQLSTDTKVEFINRLAQTGLTTIEVGSFVSPKWVPQMANSAEVFQQIKKNNQLNFPMLVPNLKGFEAALKSGVKEIAVYAAASEKFSQKNTNCSIDESLQRLTDVIAQAKLHHIKVRGYVSCVLGCPYEGEIAISKVTEVAEFLFQQGCYEISLGDTIGVGTPLKVQAMLKAVSEKIPVQQLAVHFHDTYGQALANIFAAIQCGIQTIDSAIAGLGGCPYAKGASGNVATEDVLYMLDNMGIHTGISLEKLLTVSQFICDILQHPPRSKVTLALQNKDKK